jgi:hypothetical protein
MHIALCGYIVQNDRPWWPGTSLGSQSAVGSFTVGTSFVQKALSSANEVSTRDDSLVCWQIN